MFFFCGIYEIYIVVVFKLKKNDDWEIIKGFNWEIICILIDIIFSFFKRFCKMGRKYDLFL